MGRRSAAFIYKKMTEAMYKQIIFLALGLFIAFPLIGLGIRFFVEGSGIFVEQYPGETHYVMNPTSSGTTGIILCFVGAYLAHILFAYVIDYRKLRNRLTKELEKTYELET